MLEGVIGKGSIQEGTLYAGVVVEWCEGEQQTCGVVKSGREWWFNDLKR